MTVGSFNQQVLTSDDIREALNKVVSKKLFWGKQAAKKMAIENVISCVPLSMLYSSTITRERVFSFLD